MNIRHHYRSCGVGDGDVCRVRADGKLIIILICEVLPPLILEFKSSFNAFAKQCLDQDFLSEIY